MHERPHTTAEKRSAAKARSVLQGTPFRDEHGVLVLDRGTGVDLGGAHYWGAVSQAPPDARICTAWEWTPGQGNWTGGCGMIVAWEKGVELPIRLDGAPDLAKVIIDSPHFKHIQSAMPVTKTRSQR
jgi:hypothetical protein